jgi:hypothetical protein
MSNLHSAVVAAAQAAVAAELAASAAPNLAQGTYTNAKVVVNNQGQVTAIESTPQQIATSTMNTATGNVLGVTYTAATRRLVAVSGEINLGVGHSATLQALVNGTPVCTNGVTNSSGICAVTFLVPAGATYRVNTGGIAPGDSDPCTLYGWTEWSI